jgi:hypothetical protein
VRKAFVFSLVALLSFTLCLLTSNVYAAAPCSGTGDCTIQTAIGPISTNPQSFTESIFNAILGIAGGIALLLIMVSGYKYMTSQGNPEAVKAATEQLTSAIIGLLFIILSFVILEIIGVDILKIPGFG